MEIKYGRIRNIYYCATDNGEFGDIYKCNTCGKERPTKGGLKTHLAQVHRDMIQSYDLIFHSALQLLKI